MRKTLLYAWRVVAALTLVLSIGAGCRSPAEPGDSRSDSFAMPSMTILPGDEIEIVVFGGPEHGINQRVRPDGKIAVKLMGELQAAGKTPSELKQELEQFYRTQLKMTSVSVVVRSAAVVYVTGAVQRPGKVEMTRPLTVLDAVMEAGGFDRKAGAKSRRVCVIRQESNTYSNFVVDLDGVLDGKAPAPFYLKPYDTVSVPGTW